MWWCADQTTTRIYLHPNVYVKTPEWTTAVEHQTCSVKFPHTGINKTQVSVLHSVNWFLRSFVTRSNQPSPLIILSRRVERTPLFHWRCHFMSRCRWRKRLLTPGSWRRAASHDVGRLGRESRVSLHVLSVWITVWAEASCSTGTVSIAASTRSPDVLHHLCPV